MVRFTISFSTTMRALLGLLGLGPRRSWLDVGAEQVDVRMGWAFHATIPRSAVVEAARPDRSRIGWGVHGWNGRYLINGSRGGLVRIVVSPPQRATMIGLPVTLRELTVSVDDPDGLVGALANAPAVG